MAIAVAGSSAYTATAPITPSSGAAVPLPSGMAVGDYILVAVYWAQLTGGTAVNTPSGWTLLSGPGNSSNRTMALYGRAITSASDLSAIGTSVTVSSSTTTASRLVANAHRLTGVDLTKAPSALTVAPLPYSNSAGPSYTFTQPSAGDTKLFFLGTNTAAPSTGGSFSSTGGTLVGTNRTTSAASGSVADSQLSTFVGGTGATSAASTANWVHTAVGLYVLSNNAAPVAAFNTSVSGLNVTVTSTASDADGSIASTSYAWGDGTNSAGPTHAYTAGGTYTITQTVTDNLGATGTTTRSVTVADTRLTGIYRVGGVNYPVRIFERSGGVNRDLANTVLNRRAEARSLAGANVGPGLKPWFCLHRGGSYNYPEETLYGYQGVVDSGARILEVSLQKSSNGTWWGFHDATVNRTVVNSGGTAQTGNVSSFTDAQLGALFQKGSTATVNTGQPMRPIASFAQILAQFSTMPMFVEDKTYTNYADLLNTLDANGGPSRFVIKLDALSGASFYTQAAARGYQTWGYIFDASMANSLNSALAKGMTMLGMDFNSSDATLTSGVAACIAAGVRPTGHIVPTTAIRDRLLGLGMTGMMISNKLILPNLQPLP